MALEKAFTVMDSILPGETVLIEYMPSYIPEFALKVFIEYSRDRKVPLVIDDNFDALHTLHTHLKALDVNVDINEAYVIKTGGKREIGKVIAKIPFHPDAGVYSKNYENACDLLLGKVPCPFVNLVIGIENLFLLMRSTWDAYQLVLSIQRFLGKKERKAFYLINKAAMEELSNGTLAELERIASTVISLHSSPSGAKVKVVKSVNPKLMGIEAYVSVEGLV